jgi:CheY-like chemotaxis protein
MALTRLLLERVDGELTPEQVKQVTFIRQGTESLIELVNDLLDIAKVEAGKIDVHVAEFTVTDLFGALRGMLRPLLVNDAVSLIISDDVVPAVMSDEGKVAQILRNLISNALKYTERGEVRVWARYLPETDSILFGVADTGIGIALEYRQSIFQEFTQITNPLQSRVKGTGLGLPLSKKLAELLGGTITLESEVGRGSTFTLIVPRHHSSTSTPSEHLPERGARTNILMIDDEPVSHYLVEQSLPKAKFNIMAMTDGAGAIGIARNRRPDLILLDLVMPRMSGFEVLEALRSQPDTRGIPVIVYTSKTLMPHEREWIASRGANILAKDSMTPETLRSMIERTLEANH